MGCNITCCSDNTNQYEDKEWNFDCKIPSNPWPRNNTELTTDCSFIQALDPNGYNLNPILNPKGLVSKRPKPILSQEPMGMDAEEL